MTDVLVSTGAAGLGGAGLAGLVTTGATGLVTIGATGLVTTGATGLGLVKTGFTTGLEGLLTTG